MTSVSIFVFGCIHLLLGAWAICSTVNLSDQAGVRATGWIVGVGIPLAQVICIVAVLWHAGQLAPSRDKNIHVRRLLIPLCLSFLFIAAALAIWWDCEQ